MRNIVSIHAARAGGDGRHMCRLRTVILTFQSTPPARGGDFRVSDMQATRGAFKDVSIHAARAGGDHAAHVAVMQCHY
jgi:hypothetical protein